MNPPSGLVCPKHQAPQARLRDEYPIELAQELLGIVLNGLLALYDSQIQTPICATLSLVGKGAYSPHTVTVYHRDDRWHLVLRGGDRKKASCEAGQLLDMIRALCDLEGGCYL